MVRKAGSGLTREEHLNSAVPESVKMFEEELVAVLKTLGLSSDQTLSNACAYAAQDAQYSPYAKEIMEKFKIINKYENQYGNLTIGFILNST